MESLTFSPETLESEVLIVKEVLISANFYRMVCFYFVMTLVYKIHGDTNTREILKFSHLMNKNQIMYSTIADNLDEGVIVKNTVAGLHYFNQKGMDFLTAAAALSPFKDIALTSILLINDQI